MKQINLSLVVLSAFLVVLSGLPPSAEAANAFLYLSPNQGSFDIGSTFDVSIFIDTGDNNINAIKVDLKFDPRKLQIASPSGGKSFISVWVSQPTYSNIEGFASFQGGLPSPGINTSSGLVSTITFRAITPGQTTVSFQDSSQALLDDGQGTNILDSLGKAVYTLALPAPAGPEIVSPTHPDQNKWFKNNSPTFNWQKEDLVDAFSYQISPNYYNEPDNSSEGDQTSVSFSDLAEGVWYFSLKARKAGVWGGVSRYLVKIDTTPPAEFSLSFDPILRSPVCVSKEPIVRFITTDAVSGIDHYELRHINLTSSEEKETFFIEVNTPYRMPSLEFGEHEIIVRAFDAAGNYKDSAQKIEVIPIKELFYISKNGVNILSLYLEWHKVILLLLIIIFLIIRVILLWWRKNRVLKNLKEKLGQIKKETKKWSRN